MDVPTKSQVIAAGRHALTFAMGGITAAAALHVISPSDATSATAAVNQISAGLASIIAGLTTLVGIASGLYAAWSASPLSQIFAVKKLATDTPTTTGTAAIQKDAQVALVNAAASIPGTQKVVNPMLADNPATVSNVVKQ